ncbi:MAG: arginine N-succinyltransferase [Planctomycetota bacterium]|nr:arginine N-succinyltransferase [Planctomycetota bacterium]
MVLVRPVAADDLEQLLQLAEMAGVGLTTLPKDRDLLRRRILKSQRSIENVPDRPGGESYMFVMEEVENKKIIGASGIVSKVGGYEPFYAYRLETITHESESLRVHKHIQVLQLVRNHDGPAEVGSLFLSPDHRKKDYGRLLQLVRFLFVAEHREAFEPVVVSELRGVIDANGHSAFWDAVGRHFFDIEFPKADYLSVVNKKFIADLMPTIPLYVPLLPKEAQEVIGKVHESSKPALKNLEAEGFKFNGMVDIFDAGACVSCPRDEIRTVRTSRSVTVEKIDGGPIESPTFMIGTRGSEFRAVMGPVQEVSTGGVRITNECAASLLVKVGDRIRIVLLRPDKAAEAKATAREERSRESD